MRTSLTLAMDILVNDQSSLPQPSTGTHGNKHRPGGWAPQTSLHADDGFNQESAPQDAGGILGSYRDGDPTPRDLQQHFDRVQLVLSKFASLALKLTQNNISLRTDEFSIHYLKRHQEAKSSEVFYSDFEQVDFGDAKEFHGTKSKPPRHLIPDESRRELKAFSETVDDDSAIRIPQAYGEPFRRFCKRKYKVLLEKKLIVEFDLDSKDQVDVLVQLRHAFLRLAKQVWMLHKLSFSFKPNNAQLMRVRKGEPFDDLAMESVEPEADDDDKEKLLLQVAFPILPGFRINNSVVKSLVYLEPAMKEIIIPQPSQVDHRPREVDPKDDESDHHILMNTVTALVGVLAVAATVAGVVIIVLSLK